MINNTVTSGVASSPKVLSNLPPAGSVGAGGSGITMVAGQKFTPPERSLLDAMSPTDTLRNRTLTSLELLEQEANILLGPLSGIEADDMDFDDTFDDTLLDDDLFLDDNIVSGQGAEETEPVEIQAAELEEGELEESEAEEADFEKVVDEQIAMARAKSLYTGQMSSESVVTRRKPVHQRLGFIGHHHTAPKTLGCALYEILRTVRATSRYDVDTLDKMLSSAEYKVRKSRTPLDDRAANLLTMIRVRVWQTRGRPEDHLNVLALVGDSENFGYRCNVAYSRLALGQLDKAWKGFKDLLDLPSGDTTLDHKKSACIGLCKVAEKLEQKDRLTALSYCYTLMCEKGLGDRDKNRLLSLSLDLYPPASAGVNSLPYKLALAARNIDEGSESDALPILDALEIKEDTENIGSLLYQKSFLTFNAIHRLISREGYNTDHKSKYIKMLVDAQEDCEKAISLSSGEKFKGQVSSLKGHVEKLMAAFWCNTPKVSSKLKHQSRTSYSNAAQYDPTRAGNYQGQNWRWSERNACSAIREKEERRHTRHSDDRASRSSGSETCRDRSRSPHSSHRSTRDDGRSSSRYSQSGSRHRSSHESQDRPHRPQKPHRYH